MGTATSETELRELAREIQEIMLLEVPWITLVSPWGVSVAREPYGNLTSRAPFYHIPIMDRVFVR